MSLKCALVIPDTHRPFHSKRAYSLALEVASFIGIHEVVLLGDYGDFYSVSSHPKNPRLPAMLEAEVRSVVEGLDELDKVFPRAKKIYLEGNHEFRLERYLTEKAPALFGLTSCKALFQIDQRPLWSYLSFGRTQAHSVLGTHLHARHTPLSTNVKSALALSGLSYCYGHNHKIEQAHYVDLSGKSRVGFSCGWLGDERAPAFDYMLNQPQWQHGFAIVYGSKDRSFYHQIVEIKNNKCVVNGKVFEA